MNIKEEMNMRRYMFRGLSFGNNEVMICVEANSLDEAWEKVFIEHAECWSVSFLGDTVNE
jgi:hypothetical protein